METRYEVLCVNVKLIEVQLLILRAIFQILPLLVANVSFTDARTSYGVWWIWQPVENFQLCP